MLRIDKAILDTNGVICDNIAQLNAGDRGLLSQNILVQQSKHTPTAKMSILMTMI